MKSFIALVVCILFVGNASAQQQTYNEMVDGRIGRQLDVLRTQTLEESLTMLDRMEPYMWPGAIIRAGRVMDRYENNLSAQKMILSSRVFRKCLQEMKLLPPQEAARLIEDQIEKTLPLYFVAIDEHFEFVEQRLAAGKLAGMRLSEGKDGKPTPTGLRYKLFALLLLAGACELVDSHEAMNKVAKIALKQREEMAESWVRLVDISLWNTHVLAAGLYGTHPHKDLPEFGDIGKRYTEHPFVDYTANRTEFDDSFGMEVVPDKEYINIRLFEDATDEDVMTLLGISNE